MHTVSIALCHISKLKYWFEIHIPLYTLLHIQFTYIKKNSFIYAYTHKNKWEDTPPYEDWCI